MSFIIPVLHIFVLKINLWIFKFWKLTQNVFQQSKINFPVEHFDKNRILEFVSRWNFHLFDSKVSNNNLIQNTFFLVNINKITIKKSWHLIIAVRFIFIAQPILFYSHFIFPGYYQATSQHTCCSHIRDQHNLPWESSPNPISYLLFIENNARDKNFLRKFANQVVWCIQFFSYLQGFYQVTESH